MRYVEPTPAQLEALAAFLVRDAREVFGSDVKPGRVCDIYTYTYDHYPPYGRLVDMNGDSLILGDRFFHMGDLALGFLAATHLGYDPFGILGPVRIAKTVAVIDIEMTDEEYKRYLRLLSDKVVDIFHSDIVVEIDQMEMLSKGPSILPSPSPVSSYSGDVLYSCEIGASQVSLVHGDDGYSLDLDGDRIGVSKTEANIFLRASEERLTDWIFGPKVDRTHRLTDLLTQGLREDVDAVFMDQSTFRNALAALSFDTLPPSRLFDLSCLAHHLVFSDSIIVPSTCSVPPVLAEVVVPSYADEVTMSLAMCNLAARGGFKPQDELEVDGLGDIQRAWTAFLGSDVKLNYQAVDRTTPSPGSWEYNPGSSGAIADPVALVTAGMVNQGVCDLDSVSEAASVHTYRYVLNERRAQLMGLPYVTSALRYPVQAIRLRNSLHFRNVVDQLLHPIPISSMELGPLIGQIKLPDALGVACAGLTNREGILPAVLDLRERMTSVREALRESRELKLTSSETLRRLRSSIPGSEFSRTVDTVIVSTTSIATATGMDLGTGLLVAKLAGPLNLAERATRLLDLIRRPHVRVVQRFNQAAASAATMEEIFRLWDMKENVTRRWFEVAASLSDLTPFESGKLQSF